MHNNFRPTIWLFSGVEKTSSLSHHFVAYAEARRCRVVFCLDCLLFFFSNTSCFHYSKKTWLHQTIFFSLLQLRNGQSVCTDNECTDLVSPQAASSTSDTSDNFTWMMFMMIAAVILYLIRPNSLRRRESDDLNKSSRDEVRNVLSKGVEWF